MEPGLTDGLTVTVIGVGTVFTALISLTLLVTSLTRFSGPKASQAELATAPAAASGAPSAQKGGDLHAGDEVVDLTGIALAAYAAHRRHRIDRGGAASITEWVHAGRASARAPLR